MNVELLERPMAAAEPVLASITPAHLDPAAGRLAAFLGRATE